MSPSEKCIFCSIARGEEPAPVVARAGRFCAFLDFRPVFKGHVLVVPVEHTPDLLALPESDVGPLFSLARRVALAVEKGLGAGGAFLCLNNKVSQSVAHLHMHVVPRTRGDGLRGFLWPRTKYESEAEADGYARRIAAALEAVSQTAEKG
jgi:histidine triad (HIT) family protein